MNDVKLEDCTATWFCSECMGFKKHTNIKMISEDMAEGDCECCGKLTLQVFNKIKPNPMFGNGVIKEILE